MTVDQVAEMLVHPSVEERQAAGRLEATEGL